MSRTRQVADQVDPKTGQIVRYAPATRINHWIVAISFVLLALSGLALFYPPLFWLANLFGGGDVMRAVHPWIGLVMAVAFFAFAAKVGRDNRLQRADREWLRRIGDVVRDQEENLPEVGRNNAGQKLVYLVALVSMLVLLVSGLVIWRAYFSDYFPVDATRVAALAHAAFAFVLILTIVVHVYAGIWVKGSLRAMTRGTVSPGWAWKHHRAWFRDVTKHSTGK
ncbi:formate dehydrogenase subunit gamma [Tahibacter caeni]|uniref:formate dehydrogenase subunit gamma n=1 Tax=Tahibacter caeni TaxID=1453545 RepID=UPI002147D1AC|nr:formate dehydrogenase subunit gamma [Tahibacter caeni]